MNMAADIKVLVLTGLGLNCEEESRFAWQQAGARPELMHLNDLIAQPAKLDEYHALMFIGGFSYGDHLSSGHVFALRLRHALSEPLCRFVSDGRLVLGVCNGFQIMTKLGLLPGLDGGGLTQAIALVHNDCGRFQNYWVQVRFEENSPCVFTRGLGTMPLPVRHGEGKLFVPSVELLQSLETRGCVACRYVDPATGEPATAYPANPNGSVHAIAGLCDPSGRIFGLMPHPEAYLYPENHPQWEQQKLAGTLPATGLGLKIFENAVSFLRREC